MDVAGLSPERRARSSTTHRSAGTRDRRGRRAHAPTRPAQARPTPAAERVTTAAPDAGDQLQAEYFVRVLAGRRGLIHQRIEECQRKIAKAEAKGDADAVADFRRLMRTAEQDRQTVDALLEKLCRRFSCRVPGDVPAPRGRVTVRRPAPGQG